MRVLFDAGTPYPLRRPLTEQGYSVETAQYHGWQNYGNSELLDLAEQNDFQVLVTTDQRMESELMISKWKVGIVVLTDTNWNYIKYHIGNIVEAIKRSQPGRVIPVEIVRP